MSDLCFLDTETLGLDPLAPVWEFACIRVRPGLPVVVREFTIEHDPSGWVHTLPVSFQQDYYRRYHAASALTEPTAAEEIHFLTNGATIVGCNPGFDLDSQRLAGLLRRNGIEPAWHYHPQDTASLAVGFLAGRGQLPPMPWKSDELSRLIGVDPARFDRHTALGDARWCQAQWHHMMIAAPVKPAEQMEDWQGKAQGQS